MTILFIIFGLALAFCLLFIKLYSSNKLIKRICEVCLILIGLACYSVVTAKYTMCVYNAGRQSVELEMQQKQLINE